jgi:hypothetical protein
MSTEIDSYLSIYPRAFMKWFNRNYKKIAAANPGATPDELKKIACADWWHKRLNV